MPYTGRCTPLKALQKTAHWFKGTGITIHSDLLIKHDISNDCTAPLGVESYDDTSPYKRSTCRCRSVVWSTSKLVVLQFLYMEFPQQVNSWVTPKTTYPCLHRPSPISAVLSSTALDKLHLNHILARGNTDKITLTELNCPGANSPCIYANVPFHLYDFVAIHIPNWFNVYHYYATVMHSLIDMCVRETENMFEARHGSSVLAFVAVCAISSRNFWNSKLTDNVRAALLFFGSHLYCHHREFSLLKYTCP